jgi:hypothetical protein
MKILRGNEGLLAIISTGLCNILTSQKKAPKQQVLICDNLLIYRYGGIRIIHPLGSKRDDQNIYKSLSSCFARDP